MDWTITVPQSCQNKLTQEVVTAEDVDSLVTSTSDVFDSDGTTLKQIWKYSFTISDGGDLKKARTRTFNVGVRVKSTDSSFVWKSLKEITYTNPCDSASFFSAVTVPLLEIQHIPGKFGEQ